MITVELPDGTKVEFPDGTPQDVMRDALRRRFGAPQPELPPNANIDASQFGPQNADAMAGVLAAFGAPASDPAMAADLTEIARGDQSVPHQMARSGLQGLTFGGGDEVTAALESTLSGADYDAELDRERGLLDDFREERPLLSMGSEIAGAVALPIGVLGQGRNLGLGMRSILSALTGAAQGGAYGFLAGEDGFQERVGNMALPAAIGGAIGGLIPVAGRALQSVDNAQATRQATRDVARTAPTTEQLRAQARAAYQQVDEAGVQIRPEAFAQTLDDITANLRTAGLSELPGNALNPKTSNVLQTGQQMVGQMSRDPTAALPFSALDQLRRQAGNVAADSTLMGRPTPDARLGTQMIEGIDDFVENLTPDQVTTGDVQALQSALNKAREVYSRMSRSQLLDDAIDNSQNYLAGDASGARNQFARILRNPRLSRGFDDAEIAAMRRVVRGTIPEKLLHLLGGGLGNLATIGVGTTLGPWGALAGAGAAAGLRTASDAVAMRNAEIARALVASGGLRNLNVPQLSDDGMRIVEQLLGMASRAPMAMAAQ